MGDAEPQLVLELPGAALHHDDALRAAQGLAQGKSGEGPQGRGAEEAGLHALPPQLGHRALHRLRGGARGHEQDVRVLGPEEVGPLLAALDLSVLRVQVPVVTFEVGLA